MALVEDAEFGELIERSSCPPSGRARRESHRDLQLSAWVQPADLRGAVLAEISQLSPLTGQEW